MQSEWGYFYVYNNMTIVNLQAFNQTGEMFPLQAFAAIALMKHLLLFKILLFRNQSNYKSHTAYCRGNIMRSSLRWLIQCFVYYIVTTVIILNIGTDRSEQTVQTLIRLLLKEQSDQGLLCLLFCLHLLNTILHCKIQLFQL